MVDLLLTTPALQALRAAAFARVAWRHRDRRRRNMGTEYARFYRHAWQSAATQLGASYCRITLGPVSTVVSRNTTALDDPVTLELAGDKELTYALLEQAGLPVPRHLCFSLRDRRNAAEFLRRIAQPCVIKPASGTGGGRGVTTGITTGARLAKAIAHASVYGTRLVIEEQVAGDNYRLLFLDGRLIDAFVRHAPHVIGDGRSSIAELIHSANAERLQHGFTRSQVLITIDADLAHTLSRQGFCLRSIPTEGRSVALKTVINENAADDNQPAMHCLGEAVIDSARRAAAAVGVRWAGVDLILNDPTQPLEASGGVVLEVNTTPGLYYHHQRKHRPAAVAVEALRELLRPTPWRVPAEHPPEPALSTQ